MHILIVEDDPNVAFLLHRYLKPVADDIQIAYTLADARRIIARFPDLSLITLDLNLPDSRVEETLAAIPELREAHHDALIIVVSGAVPVGDELAVLSRGADGFMHKNLIGEGGITTLRVLHDIVTSVIKRPSRFQSSVQLLEHVVKRLADVIAPPEVPAPALPPPARLAR